MIKEIDNRVFKLTDNFLIAGIVLSETERQKCLGFIGKPEKDLIHYLKKETVCKRTDLVVYSTDFRNTVYKISFYDNKYCYRFSENLFVVFENRKFKTADITGAIEYLRKFLDDLVILKILGLDKLDVRKSVLASGS
ncbi:MAG: hypothetical protein U0W24_26490 [Bacteroidales bacterium]